MKRIVIVGTAVLASLGLAACRPGQTNKAQVQEFKQQNQDSSALITSQPVPHFNYSQIRQNAIEIETAQANGVQTTTFFFNWGGTKPIKSCPSIGAPIATTTQITNPQQPLKDNAAPLNNGGGNLTVGQMDPNGVYTGDSTGTYVMCVGADGRVHASYWEGYVETEFGPATWNSQTQQIQDVGPSSFHFTKSK